MSGRGSNYGSDMFTRGKSSSNYSYSEKSAMSLKFGEENKKEYYTQSKNNYNNHSGNGGKKTSK